MEGSLSWPVPPFNLGVFGGCLTAGLGPLPVVNLSCQSEILSAATKAEEALTTAPELPSS